MIWLFAACTGPGPNLDSTASTGPTADTAHPCGPIALEMGNGDHEHVPMKPGQDVVIVHGPQDGWHVDLSAQIRRFGELVGFTFTVTLTGDGRQIAGDQPITFITMQRLDECTVFTGGMRAFVDDQKSDPKAYEDYQAFICSLDGEELEVTMTATDIKAGIELTESTTVRAVLDPVDATYNCP